ncbi:hypothetical protein [Veronia nyctiphanis]|uniref:hypothetical protein n=1 Tax=Veronia nyctiphanis TaxID=1278244 RepID=UPI001F3F4873|nr:hypothetical protein [Veronia nyctiphanis]
MAAVHGFGRALFEQHPLTFRRAQALEDSEVDPGEGDGLFDQLNKMRVNGR